MVCDTLTVQSALPFVGFKVVASQSPSSFFSLLQGSPQQSRIHMLNYLDFDYLADKRAQFR